MVNAVHASGAESLCGRLKINVLLFNQPLHRSINHFFLSTSVWLCLSHVTFASKFTAKWQVEETLAGFECTWCARWCVVLDHLGSRTGQDNSQHLWRRKKGKKVLGKWMAEASVYIAVHQGATWNHRFDCMYCALAVFGLCGAPWDQWSRMLLVSCWPPQKLPSFKGITCDFYRFQIYSIR